MSAALAVRDLVAGYGPTIILDGVSFDVPENGTLAILGRNGVGKTTLAHALAASLAEVKARTARASPSPPTLAGGGKGGADSKIEAMKAAGIRVSPNPAALGTTLIELLSGK